MFPARIPIVSSPPSGLQNTYSLSFDGSDDYVDVGSINVGTVGSVSFWAKRADTSNTYESLIRGNGTYMLMAHGTSTIYVKAGGGDFQALTFSNHNDNNWHHWTYVRDGTTVTVYLDGDSEIVSHTKGTWTSDTIMTGIGNGIDNTFEGVMDEIAIWDVALDADAVATIYNNGVPTDLNADSNSDDLQGWWRFEEGSGTSATDSSTNSNTGTLTNGPAYSTDVPS